ncbi:MAG: hypothetical protein LBQ31_04430 [Bacteroidales bacterium]|nr:hypothetical protein [Bacteroidales bacterium]
MDTKPCPYCGEEILAAAIKCKHCGEMLEEKIDIEVSSISGEDVKSYKYARIIGKVCYLAMFFVILGCISDLGLTLRGKLGLLSAIAHWIPEGLRLLIDGVLCGIIYWHLGDYFKKVERQSTPFFALAYLFGICSLIVGLISLFHLEDDENIAVAVVALLLLLAVLITNIVAGAKLVRMRTTHGHFYLTCTIIATVIVLFGTVLSDEDGNFPSWVTIITALCDLAILYVIKYKIFDKVVVELDH